MLPSLVIFDCDGVLIDSEMIVNRVVAAELTRIGWSLTPEESCQLFLGLDLGAMRPIIESELGRALPSDWQAELTDRIVRMLAVEAPMISGAREALEAVTRLGVPWRVASNSSHEEMAAKFGRNGLLATVAGRLHSFTDVAQGKPAPDLFLAAAKAEGVAPGACVVVEDSVPGVMGAVAAGMRCFGFSPVSDGRALAIAGAKPFRSMTELPGLLGETPR